MSWNLQSLNQHNNSSLYPFRNTFPHSTRQQFQNGAMQQFRNNNQINQIKHYTNNNYNNQNNTNNTNAYYMNNAINQQIRKSGEISSSSMIPQFTQSQLHNIALPPLPKELQLFNAPPKELQLQRPIITTKPIPKSIQKHTFQNQPMLKSMQINNLYTGHPLNANAMHPNAIHTININNINNIHNINNIKNVNINPNYNIINNIITPNNNNTNNKIIHPQPLQNVLQRGRIMQNKQKTLTQNRMKVKFKHPQFNNVNKAPKKNTKNKTQLTPILDDELFVDVNGVKWDNTVNWTCGVCDGADAQKENALVVCEGCSRAVHQHCYGIPPQQMTSDNDWYCQSCKYKQYILNSTLINKLRTLYNANNRNTNNTSFTVSQLVNGIGCNSNYNATNMRNQRGMICNQRKSENPFDDVAIPLNVLRDANNTTFDTFFNGKSLPLCCLCCIIGGTYKLSSDNRWVHMACCLYQPNVYFTHSLYSELPVLAEISMESADAMCNLCRSSNGACVKCTYTASTCGANKQCDKWFHITCIQQNNLYLWYDQSNNQQALTAYCKHHTQIFKNNNKQKAKPKPKRISGKKRNRYERDNDNDGNNEEYKPQTIKPRTQINRNRNRSRSNRKGKKAIILPQFSPEPSPNEIEFIDNKLNKYMDNLYNVYNNNDNSLQLDEISSISSQECINSAPVRKKRRKSAVDLLSHSSFAIKRNKWIFNRIFHLYPNHLEFYESKDFNKSEMENDNHWTLESTTDPTRVIAEECMRSVETLWTHRQTNLLAKSRNSRDYRKAIGFSILRNASGDVITSCNWSFWEVSATKKAVLIKLFITEPYSLSHIPQRRKKNGTLLAAHVMDISFRLREDVDYVVICSERGIAEIFWRALGFIDFSVQEKRSFCRGTEKDLNQFRDTILLRMHHTDYVKKYCNNTADWDEDNCAVQKVFRVWRKKHLFLRRNLVFKHKGKIIHTQTISSY